MSKKHMEDNTQYIDEERRAPTKLERKAIEAALDEMGIKKSLGKNAVLVGRQDEPYGWYLFDLGDCVGDGKSRYLILGDCLDVLEDYDGLLTLGEVHSFALAESDGRFDAIQKWGLFKGISDGLWNKVTDAGVSIEDQYMKWDADAGEWKLHYDIEWDDSDGHYERTEVVIPANLSCTEDADGAFISDLKNVGVTTPSALVILAKINGEDVEKVKTPKTVWVLTIEHDGEKFPEAHLTYDGAVEGVVNDIKEHEVDGEEYDYDKIREKVREDHYYEDGTNETTYDLAECRLCK